MDAVLPIKCTLIHNDPLNDATNLGSASPECVADTCKSEARTGERMH